ncbi:MAG: leucine-rich repeat protein [Clostridia bacterium]|nr:leucine-rich repeat protein [Clostridia bacterium]
MKLKEICEILNIKIDDEGNKLVDMEIKNITNLISHAIKKGGLYFDTPKSKLNQSQIKLAQEKGVIVLTDKDYNNIDGLYIIKVDDPKEKYFQLGKHYKSLFNIPTIAITGSVGKTTTTCLANLVFAEKYKLFSTGLTSNTPTYFVEDIYSNLNSGYEFYVQETGALVPKILESSAKILDVDAFIITNINKYHHLNKYITSEALIEDKTSYDRISKKDAVGIINIDDEVLSNHKFNHNIITFGIENKNADYIADNIKQNNETLSFNIINKGKKITTITLNIIGKHNVYNALAVYIAATHFGLDDKLIKNGLLKYKSKGIRQNFEKVCGRTIYIDTFNVCSSSIKSCLENVENISVNKGNKKIAILGGENALGEYAYKINFETGKTFGKYNLDKFVCVGTKHVDKEKIDFFGDGKALYNGAKTVLNNNKVLYYDDIVSLSKFLKKKTKPGDLILIKGIFRLGLFVALDLAFGTNYTSRNPYFTVNAKKLNNNNFEAIEFNDLKKIHLIGYTKNDNKLTIPDSINNMNVISMKEEIFKDKQISSIKFGKFLNYIPKSAFKNCDKIKQVVIPGNIKIIGESAFENCKKLQKVIIENGVLQINENAFKDCLSLKEVYLPKKIITIDNNAFPKYAKLKTNTIKEKTRRKLRKLKNRIVKKLKNSFLFLLF